MLKIAIYTSNHGYGHSSRMAALASEFIRFGIHVSIRTSRPAFLFSRLDPHFSEVSAAELDFGVKHGPNLITDTSETKSRLLSLMGRRLDLIDAEVDWLRSSRIDLVIADIPWLAIEAASYAGIPVFAVSNFDWVYIYSAIFKEDKEMRPVLNAIHGIYQRVDQAYVLPFSGKRGMMAFPQAKPVGLLARKKEQYNNIRELHSLPEREPVMLSMFGGEGKLDLDQESICKVFKGTMFSTSREINASNHIRIEEDDDFLDYIHAADIILTKPGYSSFAEAVQFGKTIIYRERLNYPEEELLIRGLDKYPYKHSLDRQKMSARKWYELLSTALYRPPKRLPAIFRNRNTDIAATITGDYFRLRAGNSRLVSVFDVGSNNLNYCLFDKTNERLIHTTQVSTGLARGVKDHKLKADSIRNFKHGFEQVNVFDHAIESDKHVIASGISRTAVNSGLISEWLFRKHGLKSRIISSHEEIRYVRLAARNPLLDQRETLCFDIGGASTEFVWTGNNNKPEGVSLKLGLLSLLEGFPDDDSRLAAVHSALAVVHPNRVKTIVGIGLTVTFLEQIIEQNPVFALGSGEWGRLEKEDLLILLKRLENHDLEKVVPFMNELDNLEVLALSCVFCIQIMDRFGRSEILVCPDGISVGFARSLRSG